MSAVSSTTSSAASYATQIAQASALKRSLNNIGNAIESGDMTAANALLTAFIKGNPQYSAGSSGSSQDPISQDFQTLVKAVSNNQAGAAQSAWTQVKGDLSKQGVNLSNGANSTAELVAQSQASTDQQILGNVFGTSSAANSSLASLLGTNSNSASSVGLSNSVLNAWISEDGADATASATTTTRTTTTTPPISVASILNAIA